MATQATPGNNHQQVPPANHPPAPAAPIPVNLDEEMDDADSSDDEEVEQLRAQITAMSTEMDGLRELIERMGESQRAQNAQYLNSIQDVNNMATAAMRGKDVGEVLKPNPPEMFDGTAYKLPTFLTQLRAFMTYYPTQFTLASSRVQYAAGRLKNHAAAWFEPVMREYLTTPFAELSPRTSNLYSNYEAFEAALRQAFGTVDEKAQAEREIKALRQTRSASEYGTKYLQLASKLNWDQQPLMSFFFDGLKKEVQAELYKEERPNNLVDYIGRAVKIDDQQFSWKKLQNPKFGNKNNSPRFDANQGKKRQNNTSYGTSPGPMELGATQRGLKDVECYYCHKKGHKANECRKKQRDIQEGRYKPRGRQALPEGRKQLNATNQNHEPQTAIRTTKTLGMSRSGYNIVAERKKNPYEIEPDNGAICSWVGRTVKTRKEEENTQWQPLPEPRTQAKLEPNNVNQRTVTIAMTRRLKQKEEKAPTGKKQRPPLTVAEQADFEEAAAEGFNHKKWIVGYDTTPPYMPSIAHRRDCQQDDPARCNRNLCPRHQLEASREYDETCEQQKKERREPRRRDRTSRRDAGDLARTNFEHDAAKLQKELRQARKERQQERRKTDEELWKEEPYPRLYDEDNNRYWNSKRERYIHTAREHVDTAHTQEICLRAYHRKLAENPRHREAPFNPQDDARTYPTHKEHPSISWMSCQHHWCEEHREEKQEQDCFPVALPAQPNSNPYMWYETEGYQVFHWYDSIGVACARYHEDLYQSIQKRKQVIHKIEDWQKKVSQEEPGEPSETWYKEDREAEESYWQWQDSLRDDHDYEACANSECEYDHLSYAIEKSKN